MERDPVCGMAVDPQRAAAKAEHAGNTYYFCGKGCAEKFRADPDKYLHPKAPTGVPPQSQTIQLSGTDLRSAIRPSKASAVRPASYICPMDPEVQQDHPGACPKCGMALEPAVPLAPATRIEYTCPMHPQIVRPGPGSCPICGMALEPRTAVVEEE